MSAELSMPLSLRAVAVEGLAAFKYRQGVRKTDLALIIKNSVLGDCGICRGVSRSIVTQGMSMKGRTKARSTHRTGPDQKFANRYSEASYYPETILRGISVSPPRARLRITFRQGFEDSGFRTTHPV